VASPSRCLQCNSSYNARAGTLRVCTTRRTPREPKLVRCVRGAIFDRRDRSPRRLADLPALARRGAERGQRPHAVHPTGLAHGFQTLAEDCEVLYTMGHRYVPEAARGVRWDDPAFAIGVAAGGRRAGDLRARPLLPDFTD